MIPYLIIFLCFFFAAQNDQSPSQKIWYYFLFFGASLMVGLRDMIGGYDVYVYGEIYEADVLFLLTYDLMEIGFRYFYLFLKFFNEDRHFMFFVMAFLIFFFQFRTYKIYSPLLLLSLFIFFCKFFLMSFVYIRQGLAMGIITLAIPFVLSKQYWKYFFIIFLAVNVHKSSILFLPFIFVAHRNFSSSQLFYMITAVVIIAVTPLNNFLLGYLADSTEDQKVAIYVNKDEGVNLFYFIEIIVLSVILLSTKVEFYKNPTTRVIANGLVVYILISLLGISNATFVRFTWYYLPFYVLGLTYFIYFQKDISNLKLYRTVLFIYFSLVFIRLLLIYDGGDFMPYKTIFDDTERNSMWEFMEYR
jgi:hypothetical protein